jgi:putative acetyltransferase
MLVTIWRSSVADTHLFVSREDLAAIDLEVQRFLPDCRVWLALDYSEKPIGFMGLADDTIESLFVAGEQRGRGVGRELVEYAMRKSPTLTTVVNEQNELAVGFYRHLGFVIVGRSPTDDDGRPYPILQMRWDG